MNDEEARSPSSVRRGALSRLLRIESEGAFAGLMGGVDQETRGAREERQVTEYVSGVTRWRRRLDFVLQHFYRGDLEAMEPLLRQVLRIGLYDILFLNTPPYAAVSEAVTLAKREVRPQAGALVNGVLRAVLRNRDALPEPDVGDPAEDLAIRYSHPTWMVARWMARYGVPATERLLAWNNERPIYGVRANTIRIAHDEFCRRLDELGVSVEESRYVREILRLRAIQPLLRAGWFEEGICVVQDEAAALIVHLLDPQPGERILDACAAPGGKAFYSAQRMNNRGEIVAVDVNENRLRLVERGALELGIRVIRTTHSDLRAFRVDAPFDRVLLDVPCSGLGVLAKRADLRWNRVPEDLNELAILQDELLDAAGSIVRTGGLLIYGTCTIEPEENEERVRSFLARNRDFVLESAEGLVPRELLTDKGYYASFPSEHEIDGAFGARLRRIA